MTIMPDYGEVVGWRVISQATDQMTTDDEGNVITGTKVRFITESGFKGTIFVPDIYYNARTVHQMITARAAIIDAVGALTPDSFV